MVRNILSVIAGYAVMVLVTIALFAVLAVVAPGALPNPSDTTVVTPGTGILAVILAAGFAAAVLGGWVTARLAKASPGQCVGWLAGIVFVLSIVSAMATPGGSAPLWYSIGLSLVGVCGAVLGGRLQVVQRRSRLVPAT